MVRSTLRLTIGVLVLTLALGTTARGAERYVLDPQHTSILFKIKHLGIAYLYGWFRDVKGEFVVDIEHPERSSVRVEIPVESLDTRVPKRDKHLKSPDFFDAKSFPLITFESTEVRRTEGKNGIVTGNLTIHGVTKRVSFPITYTGEGQDPWGGYRMGYEATLTIDRRDFGMNYQLGPGSNEVTIILSVEGVRQ